MLALGSSGQMLTSYFVEGEDVCWIYFPDVLSCAFMYAYDVSCC